MREYPSNSHKSKQEAAEKALEERKVQKVVTGKAKTRGNAGRKLADIFIAEDAGDIKSYLFMDVIVPAVKKLMFDIITDTADKLFYGGTGSSSKNKTGSKVSYRSYYDDRHNSNERERANSTRARFDYDDIVFPSRGDAEAVREQMVDMIDRYGFVTVADMYDMAELTAPYTSNKYGWVNIRSAEAVRVRNGYILKLPKASPID